MIYLNNAGTTWPKPPTVHEIIAKFNQSSPDEWLSYFNKGLETVTSFLGIEDSSRFLFTQSCTQSLAVALGDFAWEAGDRLAISTMEHHALSRWMYKLQNEREVTGVIIPRDEHGPIALDVLEKELQKGIRMVAASMASNVTGEILPYEEIIQLCKKYKATCLLDGAQTTGILPIDLSVLDPDIFVFAGHKGPFGPQGIGGLHIADNIPMTCPSAACEIEPGKNRISHFPTYCDTGSAPMMTIAGLTAGIDWHNEKGWEAIVSHRKQLTQLMREGLESINGVEIVGSTTRGNYTGAVSMISHPLPLDEIKNVLWEQYSIKGNLGFQCAPLAHEALGTAETGTLRFSVGPFNQTSEVEYLLDSLSVLLK